MSDLVEKLCRASFPDFEPDQDQEPAVWFELSDNIANIKSKNFSNFHPSLVLDNESLKFGFVYMLIRTSTGEGSIPNWLPHEPHDHGTGKKCGLNKFAYLDLTRPKKIYATHFLKLRKMCNELDQSWLRSLDICRLALKEQGVRS
jgi:hypothetical protein